VIENPQVLLLCVLSHCLDPLFFTFQTKQMKNKIWPAASVVRSQNGKQKSNDVTIQN